MTGIYIHFPFCLSKCNYCNFSSITDLSRIENYINELVKEIEAFPDENVLCDTIYIGGGTPGLIEKKYLERILNALSEKFNFAEKTEFTMEVNPCMTDNLSSFVSLGVNRISFGVQSMSNKVLKILGRRHTSQEAIKALRKAKKLVDNISADLIIGAAVTDIEREIEQIAPFVKHFSVYMLKLEEGTALFSNYKKTFFPPDDDTVADLYNRAYRALEEKGFQRYEISNFCLDSYESRHNLKYWGMDDYVGFGCASHSFYKGRRYYNAEKVEDYLKGIHSGNKKEREEATDYIFEFIMLGLRTKFGANLEKLYQRTNYDFFKEKQSIISELSPYLEINGSTIRIKDEYLLMENHILSKLL